MQEAIICVDDELLVRKAMSRALKRRLGQRFVIETADNGASALELIARLEREQTATRAVVSDAMMPVMDGYELLAQLHRDRPDVAKIMVTGRGDDAKVERLFRESGLVAVFGKPWNSDEVCAAIEQKLGSATS